ncbi:hypothetical protein MCOR27_001535 [Pyricularia oryzae]|uniref:DUF3752 domain-containing protein n=1 Tax=Pyricularia grisea TaxID=148305 RepID=A0ABQ8NG98_PYRGI|nr:hypothetical protein MCOR01_010602 [Pyricularia oryzae]KAI6296585.1 hypothetical protein MCOR33_006856 [Pyricularia grisea]KAH9438388.1 hypothetical protein MCOR02_002022 [Pyricularia oryzae]KAI6262169.1 hypothetical protein MCOR19_001675 [Pyricularia oryzae]KAI6269746.1 hypothetical protein MCOR26_008578 [Pyricularia oryzae]
MLGSSESNPSASPVAIHRLVLPDAILVNSQFTLLQVTRAYTNPQSKHKMSSIGPQLPLHLTKRKRTPVDDDDDDDDDSKAAGGPSQPPSKISRLTNDDEIDLDDDSSDDDFGPSAAAAGPTLPTPSAPTDNNNNKPPGPRAAGPSMPPAQHTESEADQHSKSEQPARRVLGPAAPPAAFSERPPHSPSSDEDSDDDDDDDDYGPALPTSAQAAQRAAASAAASARLAQDAEEAAAAAAPPTKRDDWMIRPPPPTNKPDPTKIRAKGFATGRAATSTAGQNPGEIGSMWTETAQERKDRILSRRGPDASSSSSSAATTANKNPGVDARDAAIRAYTSQTRGKSLYEEHQAKRKANGGARTAAEEDDPSKRAFDREKDMAVGGRVTNAQMRDLRKQAADFGGRFSKGKYL